MLTLSDICDRVRAYQPAADADLIGRAYHYGLDAHRGQIRKSGDPYFAHPASVAGIITELKLDSASVCAGLLHDVVEDTLATITDTSAIRKEVAPREGVKAVRINSNSKETGRELPQDAHRHGADIRVLGSSLRPLDKCAPRVMKPRPRAHRPRDGTLRADGQPPRHRTLQERARGLSSATSSRTPGTTST